MRWSEQKQKLSHKPLSLFLSACVHSVGVVPEQNVWRLRLTSVWEQSKPVWNPTEWQCISRNTNNMFTGERQIDTCYFHQAHFRLILWSCCVKFGLTCFPWQKEHNNSLCLCSSSIQVIWGFTSRGVWDTEWLWKRSVCASSGRLHLRLLRWIHPGLIPHGMRGWESSDTQVKRRKKTTVFLCDVFLPLSADIDECSELNNRMLLCKNAKCINTVGSYQCVCLRGFTASDKPNYCVEAATRQTSPHTQWAGTRTGGGATRTNLNHYTHEEMNCLHSITHNSLDSFRSSVI